MGEKLNWSEFKCSECLDERLVWAFRNLVCPNCDIVFPPYLQRYLERKSDERPTDAQAVA